MYYTAISLLTPSRLEVYLWNGLYTYGEEILSTSHLPHTPYKMVLSTVKKNIYYIAMFCNFCLRFKKLFCHCHKRNLFISKNKFFHAFD